MSNWTKLEQRTRFLFLITVLSRVPQKKTVLSNVILLKHLSCIITTTHNPKSPQLYNHFLRYCFRVSSCCLNWFNVKNVLLLEKLVFPSTNTNNKNSRWLQTRCYTERKIRLHSNDQSFPCLCCVKALSLTLVFWSLCLGQGHCFEISSLDLVLFESLPTAEFPNPLENHVRMCRHKEYGYIRLALTPTIDFQIFGDLHIGV